MVCPPSFERRSLVTESQSVGTRLEHARPSVGHHAAKDDRHRARGISSPNSTPQRRARSIRTGGNSSNHASTSSPYRATRRLRSASSSVGSGRCMLETACTRCVRHRDAACSARRRLLNNVLGSFIRYSPKTVGTSELTFTYTPRPTHAIGGLRRLFTRLFKASWPCTRGGWLRLEASSRREHWTPDLGARQSRAADSGRWRGVRAAQSSRRGERAAYRCERRGRIAQRRKRASHELVISAQHAAGRSGLGPVRLLSRRSQHARCHRRTAGRPTRCSTTRRTHARRTM